MKKFTTVIVSVVFVLFVLLLLLPVIFKGKITRIVREELNNQLTATIGFSGVDLSLIKSFPDFTITINNLVITGNGEFEGDTLADISKVAVGVNILDVIKSDNLPVKEIFLDKPDIRLMVLANGKANWDIFPVSEVGAVPAAEQTAGTIVKLKKLLIRSGAFSYADNEMDMVVATRECNLDVSGDLSEVVSDLIIKGTVGEFDFEYEKVAYLKKVFMEADVAMQMDIDRFRFGFRENKVKLNAFPLTLHGWFEMPQDDMTMDLQATCPGSDFKSLLSLIPSMYSADFENLKATGTLRFDAALKGVYSDNGFPGFDIGLQVENAGFKYPDLPHEARNIEIDLKLTNPGDTPDLTLIDLKKLHADLGPNPIDISLRIAHPVSDPLMEGAVDAVIDFNSLGQLIPIDGTSIKGVLKTSLRFAGTLSSLEKGEYQQFNASGSFGLTDFLVKTADYPSGVEIEKALLTFTPQWANLEGLQITIENSDLTLTGKISNYLPYLFKEDAVLQGKIQIASTRLDLNQLLDIPAETPVDTVKAQESSAPEVPGNLDLTIQLNLGELKYGRMRMESVTGNMVIRNRRASMDALEMKMMGGEMKMHGFYDTYDFDQPMIDLSLFIREFDIPSMYQGFVTVEKLVPMARYCQGSLSAGLSISSKLDRYMNLILPTVTSKGKLQSQAIAIINAPVFSSVGELTGISWLKTPSLKNIDLSYVMQNGTIEIKPFQTKLGDSKAEFSGKQMIDGNIDYLLNVKVPKEQITRNISGLIPAGVDQILGEEIPLNVRFTGTLTNPEVKFDLQQPGKQLTDGLKELAEKQIRDALDAKKQEALKMASENAARILREAEQKAAIIREEAGKVADKLIKEADKQAAELIKKAEGKSAIEKNLAKAGAEKIREKARKEADTIRKEADRKASDLINQARKEAGL
jgi:hypothetical protein